MKEAAKALVGAIGRLNDRHSRLSLLELEAEALSARFGVEAPALGPVFPPVHQDLATEAVGLARNATLNGWNRPASDRARRKMVADTPGGRLIEKAGPTEAEKKAQAEAEAREAEKAQREKEAMAEIGPRMQALKNMPADVPVTGGWSGY